MAMLQVHASLNPSEVKEYSYYGIVNLLQYITASGPYTPPKKRNFLEEQLSPEDLAKLYH